MRRTTSLIAITAFAVVTVACSGEDAAESLIESAIERESGGEVDIDLGDIMDGDGFSVETEDGSMTIDEDGNFVITDADGQVITGEANDDGFSVETEEGESSLDIDQDGTITFEDEDGTEMVIEQGTAIPDDWPSNIPRPEGLTIETVSDSTSGDFRSINVSGSVA
ncbi:MAG: hypothetical protein AAGG08_09920, partial [Actinomycetota bacterium]